MNIIDRRRDPGGKSLGNRQRFLRRGKALLRQAVRQASAGRSIKEVDKGGEIEVAPGDLHEPSFHRSGRGGLREHVLPGNKEYLRGDRIPRDPQGGGGGGGGAGSGGSGEDAFRFMLSDREFLDLFLDDLELPDLAKRQVTTETATKQVRAGYRQSGPPPALAVVRTLRNSQLRHIALGRPRREAMIELMARLERLERDAADPAEIAALKAEIEQQAERARRVPFIDPFDLRFRRYEPQPRENTRAVVFCLMDVSGSMDEHMKGLAKRFFSLLYLFLTRRYSRVEVVFIRHTHEAAEVDEETFFYSQETGGTVISTALDEMLRVAALRYPVSEWNIYVAQASDGDNMPRDNERVAALLKTVVLPMSQYYVYIQVGRPSDHFGDDPDDSSGLWRTLQQVAATGAPMALRRVNDPRDIYPVFRDLFRRKSETLEAT